MNIDAILAACDFPAQIHPASQTFLDQYLGGVLAEHLFLRYFSLPNSSYIPLAECLVKLIN